jgi:hypothetical protein
VNSRQLAHVGIGLIGVWALLTALSGLMMLSAVVGSGEPPGPVLVSVGVPFALILGLSYVLVFHNAKLAEAIAPATVSDSPQGATDLARVLVVLLGVHLLVVAIPSVLNHVLTFLAAGEFRDPSSGGPVRYFIGSVVQVVLAVYLIVRPDRLLEFVRRPVPAQTE